MLQNLRSSWAFIDWNFRFIVRSPATYVALAAVLLLQHGILWLESRRQGIGLPAETLFRALAYFNAFIAAAGPALAFAPRLPETTFGRGINGVLLTGITPRTQTVGTFLPRLLMLGLAIGTSVPIAVLFAPLASLTPAQISAVFATTFALLILACGIGFAVNAVFVRCPTIWGLFLLSWLPLLALPTFMPEEDVRRFVTDLALPANGAVAYLLKSASVTHRIWLITEAGYDAAIVGPLAIVHAVVGMCLAMCGWWLLPPEFTFPDADGPDSQSKAVRPRKSRRSWRNALAWKQFYELGGFKHLFRLTFAIPAVAIALASGISLGLPTRELFGNVLGLVAISCLAISYLMAMMVLHSEAGGHTIDAIVLLPQSPSRTYFSLLAGAAPFVLPGLFWAVMSAAFSPSAATVLVVMVTHPLGWLLLLLLVAVLLYVSADASGIGCLGVMLGCTGVFFVVIHAAESGFIGRLIEDAPPPPPWSTRLQIAGVLLLAAAIGLALFPFWLRRYFARLAQTERYFCRFGSREY